MHGAQPVDVARPRPARAVGARQRSVHGDRACDRSVVRSSSASTSATTTRAVARVSSGSRWLSSTSNVTRWMSGSTVCSSSGSSSNWRRSRRSIASRCITCTTSRGKYRRMSPSQRATRGALRPRPPAAPRAAPAGPALRARHVVHGAERGIDADVVAAQIDAGAVGLTTAEHQPPSPQTFGLRDARDAHEAPPWSCCGQAEHVAHRDHRRRQALGIDARCRTTGSSLAGTTGDQHAELATLGRLEGTEGAPQQRHRLVERVRRQRRQPAVDDRQQLGVVHQHGAAAGEEALDERRTGRRRRARRQRPPEAGLDPSARPEAGVVQHARRPTEHAPVPGLLGEPFEHLRVGALPGADDRPAPAPAGRC